jgi:hypothetical protein
MGIRYFQQVACFGRSPPFLKDSAESLPSEAWLRRPEWLSGRDIHQQRNTKEARIRQAWSQLEFPAKPSPQAICRLVIGLLLKRLARPKTSSVRLAMNGC